MRIGGSVLWILAISASAGCGPSSRQGGSNEPGASGSGGGGGQLATMTGTTPTPENVCTRIYELRDAGCSFAQGYDLTPAECQENYRRSFEDRGPEANQATMNFSSCLLDNGTCDAIEQCVANLGNVANDGDGNPPPEFRTCEQTDVYAPVGVTADEFARRKGAAITRYSQHASTKEEPIEVCGIPAQMEWLLSMSCDDGSRPFRSYEHAHASREGNVGAGGRCGSIVDLYNVPCPEGTYGIFIDAYVCAKP